MSTSSTSSTTVQPLDKPSAVQQTSSASTSSHHSSKSTTAPTIVTAPPSTKVKIIETFTPEVVTFKDKTEFVKYMNVHASDLKNTSTFKLNKMFVVPNYRITKIKGDIGLRTDQYIPKEKTLSAAGGNGNGKTGAESEALAESTTQQIMQTIESSIEERNENIDTNIQILNEKIEKSFSNIKILDDKINFLIEILRDNGFLDNIDDNFDDHTSGETPSTTSPSSSNSKVMKPLNNTRKIISSPSSSSTPIPLSLQKQSLSSRH
jgi:hypothetical protein